MTGDEAFLVLPDAVLSGLGISGRDIVAAIEDAIRAEAEGRLLTAPKSALVPGDGRYIMTTLSSGDAPRRTVVKSVMVSPRNPSRGLAGIEGAILLQDSETGRLLAVMEAGWVTAVRTAGLSAVAAIRMASPRSKRIAFLGCGVQARSHLALFSEIFPLEAITAYGRGAANIERLCREARDRGLTAKACATAREAVAEADIVVSSVTLSFELEPFVDASWLKPGAFASITDIAAPWIDESMGAFDEIVIDDERQERESSRKLVRPELVSGDLPWLVTRRTQGGFRPDTRSAFIFRGLAVGDFAIACLAHARAAEHATGTVVHW